jgi:hypothetical protein
MNRSPLLGGFLREREAALNEDEPSAVSDPYA